MTTLGRVLVTGAGGFIGSRLLAALDRSGEDATGWTRTDVNLCDAAAVVAAMTTARPMTIFHLAAAGVAAARAHDIDVIARDLLMTQSLMKAAPAGARILIAGSMAEYGRGGRLTETDRCTPRTAYGIAKLASGLYAAAYAERGDLTVQIARLFGIYGPGEAPQRFFPAVVRALSAGERVALSDGLQRRDFVHVDDACAALVALARAPCEHQIVNIGTGRAVRIHDVAQWIADAAGRPRTLLDFGARPRSPGDEDVLEADVDRLTGMIGRPLPQRLMPGLSLNLFD